MTMITDDNGDSSALYRLARHGRWSSSSMQQVHDRLSYLSNLLSLSSAEFHDTSEEFRVSAFTLAHKQAAISELCYKDIEAGKTALHILCYWRPCSVIIEKMLSLAPELVLARTKAGETALHMACSNATRMASADTIKQILNIAERSLRRTHNSRQEYALLTDRRGFTPLHCACYADAPLPILQTLINAAPSAVTMKDASGSTPLGLLAKSYEPFILQSLNCPGSSAQYVSDPLRHLWDKTKLLIHTYVASTSVDERLMPSHKRRNAVPTLHGALLVSKSCPNGPSLMNLILQRSLDQVNSIDIYGNTALHYAASALSTHSIAVSFVWQLLEKNPGAARMRNKVGLYPLQIILTQSFSIRDENGCVKTQLKQLVQSLYQAYPPAIFGCSGYCDALIPHMLQMKHAGAYSRNVKNSSQMANTFELLRIKPHLLYHS